MTLIEPTSRFPQDSADDSLLRVLAAIGVETMADPGNKAMYSSDASNYRIPPLAVVRPRSAEEVAAVVSACAELKVPVTARGAGTSVAGNAIGRGVIIDFSRHMNRVLEVDPGARLARVQAGTVHADLQRAALATGLRFGPDPSTHTRCTIGGMIGNNACGSRSLGYGRTVDNVLGLELVGADGSRFSTGYDATGAPIAVGADAASAALRHIMSRSLAIGRTEFGRFGRQVSGYAVENLLPENKLDLTGALVGSEGTLALVTEATVRLVTNPAHSVLVVLGFPDIASAGDAAPSVLAFAPTACEGLDARIVDVVRARRGAATVPPLPRGNAWLFVELAGEDADDVYTRARELASLGLGIDARIVSDAAQALPLWRIREAGAGISGRAPSELPAWAGWEDAAVPPASLGAYLRRFDQLVADYSLTCMPFGHFGDGCMHVRLDFPLGSEGGADVFAGFLVDAANLVAEFGGSLSGEHGDGRARSALLPTMYSPEAIALFGEIKAVFDPGNILNPGVLVDPEPFDANLRMSAPLRHPKDLQFLYHSDDGDFAQAVHRCTGVGACRADNSPAGGVMCPSYLATREEKDSTRGRARILQEVIRGDRGLNWRSPEVHDALDLCLSCKGCASDCPTGTDMATYKSEVLDKSYRGRIRPRSHYSLGWLPRWSRLASLAPRLANLALTLPGLRKLGLFAAGVDSRRSIPPFAGETFRHWFRTQHTPGAGEPVMLFVDSFTNHFAPQVAKSMVSVLEAAGFAPRLTEREVCCALTWITTGQLSGAKRILGDTVDALAKAARDGIPIVGVEPSCIGVLRSDAVELLDSTDARDVARGTHTLAEFLSQQDDWQMPDLTGVTVVAQPHCHHHAVMGWGADEALLRKSGADVTRVSGCCGLAGNFGIERGHYEVSVAVAEQNLLPAVADLPVDAVVLADGFSCRTQLDDLAGLPSLHLAELIDRTAAKDARGDRA